jgi:hypothetical protein
MLSSRQKSKISTSRSSLIFFAKMCCGTDDPVLSSQPELLAKAETEPTSHVEALEVHGDNDGQGPQTAFTFALSTPTHGAE